MTVPSWARARGINTTHLETQYLSYQRLTLNAGFWLLDSTLIENPVVLVTASTHLLALLHQPYSNTNGFSLLEPLCNQFQSKDGGQSPSKGGHMKPANQFEMICVAKLERSEMCPNPETLWLFSSLILHSAHNDLEYSGSMENTLKIYGELN